MAPLEVPSILDFLLTVLACRWGLPRPRFRRPSFDLLVRFLSSVGAAAFLEVFTARLAASHSHGGLPIPFEVTCRPSVVITWRFKFAHCVGLASLPCPSPP